MFNLLFVCTHNRCRSVLCEARARHSDGTPDDAYSAGSEPSGEIYPDTLKNLKRRGIGTSDLRSESWDVYETLSPDAVITVCDRAAGEQRPLWLGRSVRTHWGLPDPSPILSDEEGCTATFDAATDTVERRLIRRLRHDLGRLSADAPRTVLQRIADEEPYRGRF
ncbi:MAG: arsenate reductase ArsC [Pseudomonadota bacterium]